MGANEVLRGARTRVLRLVDTSRTMIQRVLETVPPARRTVSDLIRIEVVDRAMVIGAQSLLALVPMVIVLAAFTPHQLGTAALEQFEAITGLAQQGPGVVQDTAAASVSGQQVPDSEQVRNTTGLLGILITAFSATSYARAVQRMYERSWDLEHIGGFVGRRRCLAWLLGWLVGLQVIAVAGWLLNVADLWLLDPVWFVLKVLAMAALWWWTMRMLLANRLPWLTLLPSAVLTGLATVAYTTGSTLVMPTYVRGSAEQFGTLGVVLAIATWLVGFAGVLVVSAVVGRVATEDPFLRALFTRITGRVPGRLPGLPRSAS